MEQAGAANDALHRHADGDQLVTGLLLRLDLATGCAQVINAGHVPPLLVRAGQVSELELHADPAFGVLPGVDYDRGMALATKIDATGLAIVWSGEREQAELYWEQLKGYGLTMAPLEQ